MSEKNNDLEFVSDELEIADRDFRASREAMGEEAYLNGIKRLAEKNKSMNTSSMADGATVAESLEEDDE